MVPNEKFITTTFVNWTRDDPRQRYEVDFQVAYNTDLDLIPEMIGALSETMSSTAVIARSTVLTATEFG